MSEIGKHIGAIISKKLAPFLRDAGFKRKGRTFHRMHDDRIDVVNVQGSKWNSADTGEITINLGVYYPEVAKLYDPWAPNGLPQEYHCTARERLGVLMTGGKDRWWKVNPRTDDEALSNELVAAMADYGLIWLEKMGDLDSLKGILPAFISAAIALSQGRKEEAKMFLLASYKEAPCAADDARKWGIKHGLEEA